MAKILSFRCAELRRSEPVRVTDEGASAEVIVFPGVRYERWGQRSEIEGQRSAPAGKRRRRDEQRDVLELAE